MHKVLQFLKRRPEISRNAFFDECLRDGSAPLARLPGLCRLTISLEAAGEDGAFDAILELWFDDLGAADRSFDSPEGRAVATDFERRTIRRELLHVDEHRFVDVGLPAPCKLIAALKRRTDMSHAEFKSWWLERHAPQVVVFPELRRYAVNIVGEGAESFVDGIAEVGYADIDAATRITSSPQVRAVQGDSQAHTSARYRMYVVEHPVIR